jgi:hypothetical protein
MVGGSSGLVGCLYDGLVVSCGETLLVCFCDCRWFGNCNCLALCYGGRDGFWVGGSRLCNGSG